MWSNKRKILYAVVFTVSVATMTVTLLEMQDNFMNRRMVSIKRKTKVVERFEDVQLLQNVEKGEHARSMGIHRSAVEETMVKYEKQGSEADKKEIRSWNIPKNENGVESFSGKKDEKAFKGSDSNENSLNYNSKSDGKLKEEDILNIPHKKERRRKKEKLDEKILKTFQNDMKKSLSDDSKGNSLLDIIHKAAKEAQDTGDSKVLSAKQKLLDLANLLQHEFNAAVPFILDTSHVRNCISGDIIGTVPEDIEVDPFTIISRPPKHRSVEDEESFRDIYKGRKWGTNWDPSQNVNVSASGRGANIFWTQEVTATLHNIINQLKIILRKDKIRMLDVPCGDMLWMGRFLSTRDDIQYTGIDIVPELIAKHKRDYRDSPYKFKTANILETGIKQPYDLILSRMMLQHLYNSDVEKFLQMVSDSGSKYLLTTTFPRHEVNKELHIDEENPGRFRRLNLEVPPFSLAPPICIVHDGPPNDFVRMHHYASLWKLPLYRATLCRNPWAMYLKGSKDLLYSCVQWGHRQP